jgi:hypothetical protein
MARRAYRVMGLVFFMLAVPALAGCSGGESKSERSTRENLKRCEQYLGEANLKGSIDSVGGGEKFVSATDSSAYLVGHLTREAKGWSKGDLRHNRYVVCRIDFPLDEGGAAVIAATVKWSNFTFGVLREPEYAKSWKQLNDQVFVGTEAASPTMKLLVTCGVPGAPSGQQTGLPLEFQVADPGLEVEQRQALLSTFARTVVKQLACTGGPAVPAQLVG